MIEFAKSLDEALRRSLASTDPWPVRGTIVRCTPNRVTTMHRLRAGEREVLLFCKRRSGAVAAAEAEWFWLHELARLRFHVSEPAFFARAGEQTVVATLAAPGRPLPALLAESDAGRAVDYATAVVVPVVRRLHAHRFVFRDLYWQHLFAPSLQFDRQPAFIDVERVVRPRLWWRRWVVKDLAGLVSSWPAALVAASGSRQAFARALVSAYSGDGNDPLLPLVLAKAQRIAQHAPKFGT